MRGISEERLRALFSDYQHKFLYSQLEKMYEPHAIMNMLHMLIDECKELSPWMPIDENTPKSKEILVYDERFGSIRSMFIYGEWRTGNVKLRNIKPTHWMPLPEPPK